MNEKDRNAALGVIQSLTMPDDRPAKIAYCFGTLNERSGSLPQILEFGLAPLRVRELSAALLFRGSLGIDPPTLFQPVGLKNEVS